MKKSVQNFFREMLKLMFNAAALVVDTLRTFFLKMCIRDSREAVVHRWVQRDMQYRLLRVPVGGEVALERCV